MFTILQYVVKQSTSLGFHWQPEQRLAHHNNLMKLNVSQENFSKLMLTY